MDGVVTVVAMLRLAVALHLPVLLATRKHVHLAMQTRARHVLHAQNAMDMEKNIKRNNG